MRGIQTGSAVFALTLVLANGAVAQSSGQLTKTDLGVRVETAQGTLVIEPWTSRIIHVSAFKNGAWKGAYNPSVIAKPEKTAWKVKETGDAYVISTSALQVRIDRATGKLTFLDAKGKVILDEPANARATPASGSGDQQVRQTFVSTGAHFGLGQHSNGLMDYRGNSINLRQENRDVGVPMLVAQAGYGILWNNAAVTDVHVENPDQPGVVSLRSEAGGGIDYDFIYGPKIDEVVAGYRQLTGDAPMMARWTWGLFQSKEHYKTQKELLDIAARYRAMNVPIDAVVQDWQYWSKGQWGAHVMEPSRFPDPAAMVKTLHDENMHVIVSVWARFDQNLDNLAELEAAHAVYPTLYPNVYPPGMGRWYDAYSPAGRDIYWRQVMKGLGKFDFDGWWLDASEAELGGHWGEMRMVDTAAGPGAVVYNAYPLMHTTGVYEGMLRDQPEKRAFILTRSAYSGQQRNAAITWSGDTQATWEVFRQQVPQALNFTITGIPYWSADIGGFFSGDPKTAEYAELFTRWYQFGVFNPMFRVHGTSHPKEIWQFPAETQKVLIEYDRLRYKLLPYIYSLSWDVTHNRGTMMRPLVMDFQADAKVAKIGDQYMFGKSLLVAPVVDKGATSREVYLPGKTAWFDFWTGARIAAGATIKANAGIATIPVYAHAGSVLPIGPVVQFADEKTSAPLELRVYPGADGSFLLYDDAGDGYGYKKGEYATVALKWNDKKHALTIANRAGTFPGMAAQKAFVVTCGVSGHGASHKVDYAGKSVTVSLPDCR